MGSVGSLVLKGLIEGMVLLAIEREPTHGYGILKDFEDLLGEAPNKNQVYPLLQRLEEEGLIVSEEVEEDQRTKVVYQLTDHGAARLDEFRAISPGFKHRLIELFDIPSREDLASELQAAGRLEELEHLEAGPRPTRPAPVPRREIEGAWVREALAELPVGPPVRAPYAQVALDRQPGTGTWSLTVENHEAAGYEGAEACPLTFLYLAIQRLLFETRLPEE